MAFVCLLGFVIYCEATGNDTDSKRDAWNVIILIAGFVWGNAAKQNKKSGEANTLTFDSPAKITTETPPTEDKQE